MTNKTASNPKVISLAPKKASLKRKIRRRLRELGFSKSSQGVLETYGKDKNVIRDLHLFQRNERLISNADFLDRQLPSMLQYFASGHEIDPKSIKPVLDRVYPQTWRAKLFRLASLTWSVPVSSGFGRRLRYLVWDAHNKKLIGLIAIGDPVFNLSVRDNSIIWSAHDRATRLVNVMDAYVLGALPPYNKLLAGKMIACLVRSREIYDEFIDVYGNTTGIISGQKKKAKLLAVTTSSSMGRSSVYNRLKLGGVLYFKSIGYTQGWGHFHIPDSLFAELREYLRSVRHPYADMHQFGKGPNWRLRTTRAALEALGLEGNLLRHGIKREAFLCELASNATAILRTGKGSPNLSKLLRVQKISELALERWILPRSQRCPEYRSWESNSIPKLLQRQSLGGRTRQIA